MSMTMIYIIMTILYFCINAEIIYVSNINYTGAGYLVSIRIMGFIITSLTTLISLIIAYKYKYKYKYIYKH